jgi:hypothetical protein
MGSAAALPLPCHSPLYRPIAQQRFAFMAPQVASN